MNNIQVKHNSRLYINSNGRLEINHSDGRRFRTPQILYKYYALNKYSVDAFTNHYMYAAHPEELNDRFDCSPQLVNSDSFEDLNDMLKSIGSKHFYTEEVFNSLSEFGLPEDIINYIFRETGIISLTSQKSNILMWSHYAKNDGFCIGLYADLLPKDWIGPFPLEYIRERNQVSINTKQMSLIPLIQCFQKNKKWSYEREWRFLTKLENGLSRECHYPPKAVEGIYLGSKFIKTGEETSDDDGNMELSIKTIRKNAYRIKVLDYAIENRIPINYDFTCHIDEIQFMTYYGTGENGHYQLHWF